MGGEEGVYSFPEVLVQDGGAFGCDPAVSFPVVQPSLGDGSLEVLAVGAEGDLSSLAVLADPFEGFVGSAEFHSVVGGAWFAAGQVEEGFSFFCEEYGSEASGAVRVGEAGAVGVDGEGIRDSEAGFQGWSEFLGFGRECLFCFCDVLGSFCRGFRRSGCSGRSSRAGGFYDFRCFFDGFSVPCFGIFLGDEAFVNGAVEALDFFLAVVPGVVDAGVPAAFDDVVFLFLSCIAQGYFHASFFCFFIELQGPVFDHFPEAVDGRFRVGEAVVPAFSVVAVVFGARDEFLPADVSCEGIAFAVFFGEGGHDVDVDGFLWIGQGKAALEEHLHVEGKVVSDDGLCIAEHFLDFFLMVEDEGTFADHGRGDVVHFLGFGP